MPTDLVVFIGTFIEFAIIDLAVKIVLRYLRIGPRVIFSDIGSWLDEILK